MNSRKRSYVGWGRNTLGVIALIILFWWLFPATSKVEGSKLEPSKKAQECFEFDYIPDPNNTDVQKRAEKIVRDNNIVDPQKVRVGQELIVRDGDKEFILPVGEEDQNGVWDVAWYYERSKLSLRHGIWCK